MYSLRQVSAIYRASVKVVNQRALKHSARKAPWKDSTKALSVRLPGREKAIRTPLAHSIAALHVLDQLSAPRGL